MRTTIGKAVLHPSVTVALVLGTSSAFAGVPFPPLSTCTVTIAQYPTRTICISSYDPDVVRLTPAGSTASPLADRISVVVRVRDANESPVVGALVVFSEETGVVNIADGGATSAVNDADGAAAVALHGASGYGDVVLCADGVALCRLEVRSPDVTKSVHPDLCGISSGSSSVNGGDINNPLCGFLANFGPVTAGVNAGYDLDCTGFVAGRDIIGDLGGRGGVLEYFGDSGTLGSKNNCLVP
jgi:hypothetical protein